VSSLVSSYDGGLALLRLVVDCARLCLGTGRMLENVTDVGDFECVVLVTATSTSVDDDDDTI